MPRTGKAVGGSVTYDPSHGHGFGHAALGDVLTAEMTELDMTPGTVGTYLEDDADSGWPLFQWIDGKGIDRITTIDPDTWAADFHE
jgi:hypothetical protein